MFQAIKIKRKEFLLIWAGVTLLALGINWYIGPVGLVIGGISGIGIIVEHIGREVLGITIPLWLTNLVLNIPLFAISIKQRGFGFAKKSLYAVVMLSIALWYTEFLYNPLNPHGDLLLVSVFGALFIGAGIGLVLRSGSTTGGTDMLAAIVKFKMPSFPIAKLMLMIDGIIIIAGFFVFGGEKTMYAIISIYIISKVISGVLEGGNFAKAAFIVSDYQEEIAKAIMQEIPRGSTGISAQGMYSREQKQMLFTVIAQKEVAKLREIVLRIDPKAFVTIADVREVLGEGFIEEPSTLLL